MEKYNRKNLCLLRSHTVMVIISLFKLDKLLSMINNSLSQVLGLNFDV